MVRTRRTRKGSPDSVNGTNGSKSEEQCQSSSWKRWLLDFEMEVDDRLHKLDFKVKTEIESLERSLELILSSIPPDELKLPPRVSSCNTSETVDSSIDTLPSTIKKGPPATSTAQKPSAKSPPATSRQSSSHSRKRSLSESKKKERDFIYPVTRSSSQSSLLLKTVTKYQTPSNKGNRTMVPVTPKVDPYCPMPLKRLARQGEMAISLDGSPLMMTTNITEPNICLPVNNGEEVYSILPSEGPCPSIPLLDEKTKEKLQLLRDNLDQILGKNEK